MLNSFDNYLKMGKVKKKIPDSEEAKSLFRKAEERMEYIKDKNLTNKTAKFVLEDSYEAAREAAQSLMSIHGYKPYSHEATISFIKKFYNTLFNEENIRKFDRFRQLRNDSVYKAVEISEQDAKSSLLFASYFIGKIKPLIKHQK